MSNLIKKHDDLFDDSVVQRGMRDGIEIEKGVVLNEDYLKEHFDEIGEMFSIFTAYPDIYLDLIKPQDSNFELFFY